MSIPTQVVSPIEQARTKTNFPKLGVATFMFFAGVYVLIILLNYLPIIKTYSAPGYAFAAWILLIGIIVDVCLLVDTAVLIVPHVLEPFAIMRKKGNK